MRGIMMIAAAVLALGSAAQANGRVTGMQIKHLCITDYAQRSEAKIACEALIIGVVEGIPRGAFMSIKTANPDRSTASIVEELPGRLGFCIPARHSRGQVAQDFRRYLVKYPSEEDLLLPFDQLIYESLIVQYPCD